MINLPTEAKTAIMLLNDAGFEAYAVGGIVRNSIMNLPLSDIDITTSALPHQTKEVFKDYTVVETGIEHGTVTVVLDGVPLEITTYRIEQGYSDNRHPDGVKFSTSLKDDCARRDFTINAICYNPLTGIADFYGGREDIAKGVIRCVGDADSRFKEDALRILRAVRFASVLGFRIEPATKKAIFENKDLLKNISAERIYAELIKLLCGKNVKNILLEYTDVLGVFMPEILPLKNFDQHNHHHIYDVLTHTAVAVESCPPVPALRLAALLHDFGKPETFTMDAKGVGHFYGHGDVSFSIAKNILARLKVSNEDFNLISHLVKYHDVLVEPNEKAVKRALNKHGEATLRLLLLLKRADNAGQNIALFNRKEEYDQLENVIDSVIQTSQCFSLKQLAVNGTDLMGIGIKPSAQMGKVLNTLLDMVINGEIANEKPVLLEIAGKITKQNNVI